MSESPNFAGILTRILPNMLKPDTRAVWSRYTGTTGREGRG